MGERRIYDPELLNSWMEQKDYLASKYAEQILKYLSDMPCILFEKIYERHCLCHYLAGVLVGMVH